MGENQERKTWIMYKVADPGIAFSVCPWYGATKQNTSSYKASLTNKYGVWSIECTNVSGGGALYIWDNDIINTYWGISNYGDGKAYNNTLTFPQGVYIKPNKIIISKYSKTAAYHFIIEGLNKDTNAWEALAEHQGVLDGNAGGYVSDMPKISVPLDIKTNNYYKAFRIRAFNDVVKNGTLMVWEFICPDGKILIE